MTSWMEQGSPDAFALLLALGLLLVSALAVPAAERRHVKLPLGLVLTYALVAAVGSALGQESTAQRVASLVGFGLLAFASARLGGLLVLDVVLGRRFQRPLPKIIHDILQGLAYFAAGLVTLRRAGVEPGQLLTTSALLTAVVGLALQDTLGNLFAGLAVQAQRPFEVGDWLHLDNDARHIGRVVEVNWRATTIVTNDELVIVVPNGTIAKNPITNFSRPSKTVRRTVLVQASYDAPPTRVRRVLTEAASSAPGVLAHPPVSVVTQAFADSGIEYAVRYFLDDFQQRDVIDGGVRERIWFALRREHIEIPFPQRVVHHRRAPTSDAHAPALDRRIDALARVDVLGVLTDEQRRAVAERAATRLFAAGETIVQHGEQSQELFVVLAGEVSVWLPGASVPIEVARLVPTQFFGEMALLTGEPRRATVRAATDCELLAIGHLALESVLHEAPEVVAELGRVLAARQSELDELEAERASEDVPGTEERRSMFIGKIRRLFGL
jgi:small-conductance mechanosensitive channel/CRP-like cAMP-binding protein